MSGCVTEPERKYQIKEPKVDEERQVYLISNYLFNIPPKNISFVHLINYTYYIYDRPSSNKTFFLTFYKTGIYILHKSQINTNIKRMHL